MSNIRYDLGRFLEMVERDDGLTEMRYPMTLDFTRMQNGRKIQCRCRCSVVDPSRTKQSARIQAFATEHDARFEDIRLLRVHREDTRPEKGSVMDWTFDGGRLEVMEWSQRSEWTGQGGAVAICLLRR